MNQKNLDKFIAEALEIENRHAKEAGALGFMARAMVQATMPHRQVNGNEFKRKNGLFQLTMLADSSIGLPYGGIPRLIIAWITTEVVRTKQRELTLGNNLSKFMAELDLIPTGGRCGTITRMREQMKRLFATSISCTYDDGKNWAIQNIQPVTKANLWWHPKTPGQSTLFDSTLVIGEEFYNEIISFPIPIDMDVLRAIKRSSMAIDLYCWLTYRMSYLKHKTPICWQTLQVQFGADYGRTRDFKKYFLGQLRAVLTVYPEAKIDITDNGLILLPSKTHIPKKALDKPVDK